jgi:hypothetical protein
VQVASGEFFASLATIAPERDQKPEAIIIVLFANHQFDVEKEKIQRTVRIKAEH